MFRHRCNIRAFIWYKYSSPLSDLNVSFNNRRFFAFSLSHDLLHHIVIPSFVESPLTSLSHLDFYLSTFIFPLIFYYRNVLGICFSSTCKFPAQRNLSFLKAAVNFGSLDSVYNSKLHLLLQRPPSYNEPHILRNTFLSNTTRFWYK